MEWDAVFSWNTDRVPEREYTTEECNGSIISLMDCYHTRVLVESESGTYEVHVPHCDRFEGFREVVVFCQEYCRVGVVMSGDCVTSYQCLVHKHHFVTMLEEGRPNVMEHVLRLFRYSTKNTRLPRRIVPFVHGDASSVPSTWKDFHLFTSQEESLMWMKQTESNVRLSNCDLCGMDVIEIGTSGWCYDVTEASFCRVEASTSVVKMRLRGSIFADATGTVKTVTLLRLVCTPGRRTAHERANACDCAPEPAVPVARG